MDPVGRGWVVDRVAKSGNAGETGRREEMGGWEGGAGAWINGCKVGNKWNSFTIRP